MTRRRAHRATRGNRRRAWLGVEQRTRLGSALDTPPACGGPTRVTEIPDHLLKRSQERRAALDGDAGSAAAPPVGQAVETVAPAAVAPPVAAAIDVAPEPPKPERPEVTAARHRRKIPIWAIPVLAALPLWAYVYQGTLEPPPAGESDPMVLGGELYATQGCSGCHGADGGGGIGPAFAGVRETWVDPLDQMMWVRLGSAGWPGTTYGNTDKPKKGGMPAYPDLNDQELAQVILYERTEFGGLDPLSEEYALLVEIADGMTTFADAGLGEVSTTAAVDEANLAAG